MDFDAFFESDSDESDFDGFDPIESDSESDPDSDSGDEGNAADDVWSTRLHSPTIAAFEEEAGPNLPDEFDPLSATPLTYFLLLFPNELIHHIVTMTNGYAQWSMAQPGRQQDKQWEDVTWLEMRAFLAINILMGINQLPETPMYWSKNSLVGNASISNIMTCNRFQKILKYLHVSDRGAEPARGAPDFDKLFKVRPVLDAVSRTFRQYYTLSREASVDEAMIAFSGRLAYRQYMPAKPVKRGVKVWMLCDAQNSYLSRFDVYLGRQNNTTELGLGYNVVTKLTDHIQHTHRWLFFDNYFTGVKLMQDLLQSGLYACGTVRANRKGFPAALKKPATVRNRGEMKIMQQRGSNLTATVWKDKRLVHVVSTLSDPTVNFQAQRRIGANVVNVDQPHSVHLYNQFMGGVDHHDQHRSKYDVGRKGKKPWRYLFWFAMNCAIVNAYIIYKIASQRNQTKKRFTHLDFRLELIQELIGGFTKRKKKTTAEHPRQPNIATENINGHSYEHLGSKKSCKFHRWHMAGKIRKDTVYGCVQCKVHLCVEGCFHKWHSM